MEESCEATRSSVDSSGSMALASSFPSSTLKIEMNHIKDHLLESMAHTEIHLPPLIIGIDVPDASLDKDLVFVHGNESTQRERGDLFDHD